MIDDALRHLDTLIAMLGQLTESHFSETDTRVKFIDPLLTNVLGWPEFPCIEREEMYSDDAGKHSIDYTMSLTEPVLVVEAKKHLLPFEIPTTLDQIDYSLRGVMQNWKNAWDAIVQARTYCDYKGARYGLVTNGQQFIAFKAISEKGNWTQGHALVLGSPQQLRKHFTLFYECLAKECIAGDRLSRFANQSSAIPARQKPRTAIGGSPSGFRNQFFDICRRAFGEVLLDLPEISLEFLKKCYCTSEDAIAHGMQLNSILVDPLPSFRTPIQEVRPGHRKDAFHTTLTANVKSLSNTPLFVLMGGPGVGKTTFLAWYVTEYLPAESRAQTVFVNCDFRRIECEVDQIHDRTIHIVIDQLLEKTHDKTGKFGQLYEMFRKTIDNTLAGTLAPYAQNQDEKQRKISDILEKLQDYSPDHLAAIIQYLRQKCGKQIVILLDNVDQKDFKIQNKLYQVAHELVFSCKAVCVIALRESSYRKLVRTAKANAFSSIDFHVRAQPLEAVLEKRLTFLASKLKSGSELFYTATGKAIEIKDFERFLNLIQRSILSHGESDQIIECLSAVTNSNIREQLKLIHSFLVSGQTKIDDYFWNYTKHSGMIIPFHEFLYSLIHEDRKIYEEQPEYDFINIFEPDASSVGSHFTSLRILEYFRVGLGQSGDMRSADFTRIPIIAEQFADQGLTVADIERQCRRLADFGLLVPESLEVGELFKEESLALTAAGAYYATKLYKNFVYFSSVAVDTSIDNPAAVTAISKIIEANIHHDKIPLPSRFEIGKLFLTYLSEKENTELASGTLRRHPIFAGVQFVPPMLVGLDLAYPGNPKKYN